MSQIVTVNLPELVYQRLKERAEHTQRSIEDELIDMAASALPQEEKLPIEQANAVAALQLLDDKTLWQAARTHLSAKLITRMERLHNLRRDDKLNTAEEKELANLLKEYEQAIVIRAEAMDILMERGYDISRLINKKKA